MGLFSSFSKWPSRGPSTVDEKVHLCPSLSGAEGAHQALAQFGIQTYGQHCSLLSLCHWGKGDPRCRVLLYSRTAAVSDPVTLPGSLPHQLVPAFSEPGCCSSVSRCCLSLPCLFCLCFMPLISALLCPCVCCLSGFVPCMRTCT